MAAVEYKNVMKEKEGDFSMFLEMHNREMGRNDLSLIENPDEFDDSLGSKPMRASMISGPEIRNDDFLDSKNGKTDYDWLLIPPCIPAEKDVLKTSANAKSKTTTPRSGPADSTLESASKNRLTSSRHTRSSSADARRPSSLRGRVSIASRSAPPSGQPTLPAMVKSLTSSTPASRAAVTSNKIVSPHTRSSTPTRSIARSSTPTGRPSILAASKSVSKSATTCKPNHSSISGATTIKKPVPSRGVSPTIKSQPQKPSEAPGISSSLSERPASVSKERPHSTESVSRGKLRQKPYSASNAQISNVKSNSGRPVLLKSRKYPNNNGDVNPVLMGTQMVERVVNMRKLPPPKQDNPNSNHGNISAKPSSKVSSGFGRSLSKRSLDMAIRHMDIRQSVSGNMRSLTKDVPASSMYSLRSEPRKIRTSSTSDSPSSDDASSERSFNINSQGLHRYEVEDIDLSSEQGHSSSNSQHE